MSTTALTTREPQTLGEAPDRERPQFSLIPSTFEQAMQFAKVMSNSDLVPKDFRGKVENCFIAVQMGLEVGLSPMAAIQNIAVINGRPAMWGDAVMAIVLASGLLDTISESLDGPDNDWLATCAVKRKGQAATARQFSMGDAKRAGLDKKDGPWKQYPKRMLQMRARAFALRDVFPDVLRGIAIREEAEDIIEVTATPVSEPQRATTPATTQTSAPAANVQQAPAQAAAPAVPNTAPQATVIAGMLITKTDAVKEGVWEVEAVAKDSGETITFLTRSEDIYRQACTVAGTDALLVLSWRSAKRSTGDDVMALVGIAIDEAVQS